MTRSTFASFTTAHLGMAASQRALDVTGQNIANINTEGYTRQRLDLISLNLQNCGYQNASPSNRVGFGVQMNGISQLRDPFLDVQYRNQIAKVGTADSMQGILDKLGDIFDETDKDAFKTAIENISSSLETLSANGGEGEFDSIVRARFQVLLQFAHDKATDLNTLRNETIEGLEKNEIPQINSLLSDIKDLNASIWNSQVVGNNVLELQDARNAKLDELATYLPINVTYVDHKISDGTIVQSLKVDFVDSAGTKHELIGGDQGEKTGEFGMVKNADGSVTMNLTPSDAAAGSAPTDITDILKHGTLKGTVDMINCSGSLDTPATEVRGIGYYEKTLDVLIDSFVTTFNDLNTAAGGEPLFVTSDGSADFTALNTKISDDWMNNNIHIICNDGDPDSVEGSSGSSNILKMINALDEERAFEYDGIQFFKGSFHQCYTNIENTQALDSSANTSVLNNHIAVLREISNNKDSISGVSLDEEGMNLMHFNRSYSAAARLMTTLDEMLNTLINNTGVVGR